MNSKQINSDLLINEWQLGQQLNTAVHNGSRDKFNLLLSLLSDDARDFAQFSLPEHSEALLVEEGLRESLQLAASQPLVNQGITCEQAKSLNTDLHNNELSSIRLKQLLNNEALLSRSAQTEFSTDIVDNLSLLSQRRLSVQMSAHKVAQTGINNELMESYKALNLEEKPVKVTYM